MRRTLMLVMETRGAESADAIVAAVVTTGCCEVACLDGPR
jgi:hypothetical protein